MDFSMAIAASQVILVATFGLLKKVFKVKMWIIIAILLTLGVVISNQISAIFPNKSFPFELSPIPFVVAQFITFGILIFTYQDENQDKKKPHGR